MANKPHTVDGEVASVPVLRTQRRDFARRAPWWPATARRTARARGSRWCRSVRHSSCSAAA
eukprot:6252772-Prymnesium_polylepis.1